MAPGPLLDLYCVLPDGLTERYVPIRYLVRLQTSGPQWPRVDDREDQGEGHGF